MKMRELTLKYRDKSKYDLSCSETILYAANEKYNLGLDENHFHMMAPFSGGMMERETCGILTASISVLGILFTKDNAHNSELLKEAVLEYKTKFREQYGTQSCELLVLTKRTEEDGCSDFIVEASVLLEEIIEKYGSTIR